MARTSTDSLKEDFISRLSRNKQHVIALIVLFVLPIILYSSVLIGGQTFMANDVMQWRAGAESIIEYKEAHDGENPLWATNMFSGMPSYVISAPQSVPSLDTLVKEISDSAYPLQYFWVLLGGIYCLFILQGIRPFASVVGSILIGFTTYIPIIIEAGHNTKFVAYAIITWVLVGYWMMSRSNKKLLAFFIFSLALTLELRANHPQVFYYFIYLLGFWWIFDTVQAYRKNEITEWLTRSAYIAGAGLLAIMASLESYWRLYEYSQFSTRGGSTLDVGSGSGLGLDYAFSWSQGVGELLTLIIPGIFGGASGEAYWGPKPFTSGPHYLGAVAFLLALIGLFAYRKKIKYLFLGVGTLTMLFSLGENFRLLNEFMFNYVPFFNKFRTPEMWLIVTVFCFSVLAVFGIHALFTMAKEKVKQPKKLYIPLGMALGLGLIFAMGSNALLSFEKPGERQQYEQQVARQNNVSVDNPQVQQAVSNYMANQLKPARKAMAKKDSIRYFVIVLLASVLIYLFYSGRISKGYFLAALILFTAYDMLSVGNRYTSKDRLVPDRITAEQYIERQKRPLDEFIINNIQSEEGYPYRVFPLLDNPFNNAVPAYFYPSIGGYTGAKLAHYQDMIDRLLMAGPQGINMPILDMLNVKFISSGQQLPFPDLQQVYANQNRFVYENTNVLPKAFFVDTVVTAGSPGEAVQLMEPGSGFNPAELAVVETEQSLTTTADTAASVQVSSYTDNRIVLQTSTEEPGFLVLSEIYYPAGWQATLDGEPVPIYKTNFVLRGFSIPSGEHTLELRFKPTSAIWGARLAWAGHIIIWICGLLAIGLIYQRKS
ncbi:YfhO family protein [Balneolaceae bacterium YR4-1]|uniref:YfhO family protein n=1 Tax=Halalkalibaculum roseum TaxID=2709311 RepID=A0A6M1T3I2_9BACT|nr:YfhO family protein [Halalkalibaculum roseum]NGP78024.1 YfhO family protein [Halalkalibaculum roseum]